MKEKFFKTSALNIHLAKFKGYDSVLDIYSFQSEFDKLYVRSTPKSLLPDLLKNNYLSDPALSLVKSLNEIEVIWERLQRAYGDPKMMLQRKLSAVKEIGCLKKIKGSEKLKEGLMSIVNCMTDLMKLAEKHKIENLLYYGEAINYIYSILGDKRISLWLLSISEESLDEKSRWPKLILFLEKELKMHEEMSKIQYGFECNPTIESSCSRRSSSYVTNDPSNDACYFCGETDHVKTAGPNGMKLVQYFSCRKFVEMTPNQRFLELRNKGLCIQCLYPGASQDKGRHSDGSCSNEYACKHYSHNVFPSKKHVLTCQEHCSTDRNKELLESYRSRCILNKKTDELPDFSKNIKLSFHSLLVKGEDEHTFQETNCDDEVACYILQTIEIDNRYYTLFFDSGCSDLVSWYSAVRRM